MEEEDGKNFRRRVGRGRKVEVDAGSVSPSSVKSISQVTLASLACQSLLPVSLSEEEGGGGEGTASHSHLLVSNMQAKPYAANLGIHTLPFHIQLPCM